MRPTEAPDGPPHGGFAQLLAVLLLPPRPVFQHGGIGRRLASRLPLDFLLLAHAARAAGNRLALQRARLTLWDHRTFPRGHRDPKAASGFSQGLTLSHSSHQAFFEVGRIGTQTDLPSTTCACLRLLQVALGRRTG